MMKFDINNLIGDYDNFRQYWKENTEEDKHRDDVSVKHNHLHLKIKKSTHQHELIVKYYTGRNNAIYIDQEIWSVKESEDQVVVNINGENEIQLYESKGSLKSVDDTMSIESDGFSLLTSHRDNDKTDVPYQFLKCRYFSGFIEYALADDHEEYHRVGDLTVHDQGGMAELSYEGKHYTVELTQLVFAHVIFLMKVAIYDLPLADVGVNSKAISYSWSDPVSKRLGVNIRKIITGWTYIEEGFLSSNTLKLEEE